VQLKRLDARLCNAWQRAHLRLQSPDSLQQTKSIERSQTSPRNSEVNDLQLGQFYHQQYLTRGAP
jgi:hypothetical protein